MAAKTSVTRTMNAPLKKGKRSHVERLMELVGQSGVRADRSIFVIGDGGSDHFLFLGLERLCQEMYGMPRPIGFFVRDPELTELESNSVYAQYFATWTDLCVALRERCASQDGGLAIVDVDRTVILAKGLMDITYAEVRERALLCLAQRFAISDKAHCEAANIGGIARGLEKTLCYYGDVGDQLCCENFEVIALTALLRMMGLLSEKAICRTLPPDEELLDVLRLIRSEASRGNWMAHFDGEIVGSDALWNETLAVEFISTAISAMEEGSPLICPIFREMECAELLASKVRVGEVFFNRDLIDVLLGEPSMDVVFVSDRPILSLCDGEEFVLDAL